MILGKSKGNSFQVVKRIFKYLQGTQDLSLWYPKDAKLIVHAYEDVDWARNVDYRKHTSGCGFYMEPRFVSWFNKKQI